ncbi:MAG: hypothetical protein HOM87_05470 [Proteobacteria bacterium]|jgi:hypothetical protein|nr:hypothetical protein [Rhodospirillales bacterium]MBT4987236.1 hypothetical protein [Pseudomonadota bacterium]
MKKICKNCKQELGGGSFYKSNRSKDGLTSLCRKCNSISGDRSDEEKYRFPELDKLETRTGRKANGVRREIKKFRDEYRSAHWEPAVICLGRISEAQVFELAGCLGVDIKFPKIRYLNQLTKSHEKIREDLRVLLSDSMSFEHQKKKLQREIKNLIDKTISFSFDIESGSEEWAGNAKEQDSNFALKGIGKYIFLNGTLEQKNIFTKTFDPLYREVMGTRNSAAHAPRENQVRYLKKDIQILQPKVAKLIGISEGLIC